MSTSLENRNLNIEFYGILEQEVKNADLLGHLVCIQMDSNAKLGQEFIKGDPHNISGNGQLLSEVILRNNLVVCNGTPKCDGLITRERQTVDRLEQSIIDFIIVCPTMYSSMQSMKVDGINRMRRYLRKNKNISIIQSDHKLIVGIFNQTWSDNEVKNEKRMTIFNFKDKNGWLLYKKLTSEDGLSNCFKGVNFQEEARIWLKKFQNIIHRSFPIIRVKKKVNNDQIHQLLLEKSKLQENIVLLSKSNLLQHEKVKSIFNIQTRMDIEIASISSNKNAQIIRDQYTNLSEFGNFSSSKMWSIKKKFHNNKIDPPTAKYDKKGN